MDAPASAHGLPTSAVIGEALIAHPITAMSARIVIEPPSSTGPTAEEVMAAEAAATAGEAEVAEALLGAAGDDEKPLTREVLESRVAKTLPRKLETSIKVRPPGYDAQGKRTSPNRR